MTDYQSQAVDGNTKTTGCPTDAHITQGRDFQAAADTDPFDLIFIDAEKSQYKEYLDWSIKLSRPGTVMIADNVVRRGEIINKFSEDTSVLGIREFNQRLSEEPRLKSTVLQTVGAKRYDGFTMIVVDP